MMLKKIIVVRHGYYQGAMLTEEGRQQIGRLGKELASRVNGSSIALLSSVAGRAVDTSKILAASLGDLKFEEYICLYSFGCLSNENFQGALELIKEKGVEHEVVILSSHLEFIDQFPTRWGKTRGFDIKCWSDTPKGTARIIDVETGKVEHVQPPRT